MIRTKEDLIAYIVADNDWYRPERLKTKLIDALTASPYRTLKKYLVLLRKSEYHLNNASGSRRHTYLYWYYEGKKNRLGQKLGIEIYPNCFGKGLKLWHAGGIVVNPAVRAGENCTLHGSICIGNKGTGGGVPVLGSHVDIGFGAVVVGDIEIADNTTIGANAFVNRSIGEPGGTYVGIPAHRLD